MAVLIFLTFVFSLVCLAQYSRFRLALLRAMTGKIYSLSDQFSLSDDSVNFDKFLKDNNEQIAASQDLSVIAKKAKRFYWLQGIGGALLVLEFIALVLIS